MQKARIEEGEHYKDQLKKNRHILNTLVVKNFKSQYRNSILGALWTVLHPLLNMIVLAFVFSSLFGNRQGVGIYPVYLMCGNTIFGMMRQITSQSLTSMVNNAGLIKKVRVSYNVFPLASMFNGLVNFATSFIALIIVMLVVGQEFHWTIVMTITIVPAVLMFSLGIGYVLATLFVYFRDVKHLYEVFLTLWMYLTPMFYTVDMLNNQTIENVINWNPMTDFITGFRQMIQWGTLPTAKDYLIYYGWGVIMLAIGLFVFNSKKKKYILYI